MREANEENEANEANKGNEANKNNGQFCYAGHHKTPIDKDIKFDIAVSVTV